MRNNKIAPADNNHDNQQPSGVEIHPQNREGVCRICLEDDINMIKPCACNGSIQFVHEKCMISWIHSQITRTPNKLIICEICHQKIYYESNTQRIWDFSNCMRRMDRMNSCYIGILFCCIFCVIIISVLLHYGGEMSLGTSGKVVLILGLILLLLATMMIVAAIGRIAMMRKIKSIKKVYSQEEGLELREQLTYRSRSRRTIQSRSISRRTSVRNIEDEENNDNERGS